jgi:hypothetical protein
MFTDNTLPLTPALAARIRVPMDDELTGATAFRPLSPLPLAWPAQTIEVGKKRNARPARVAALAKKDRSAL